MDFAGRTFAVTGGASGIGRATVQLLRQRGAQVAVIDVDADAAREVASLTGARAYPADVGDEEQVRSVYAAISADLGPLNGLHSNAGINPVESPIHEESVETWDRIIRVNLRGMFLATREAVRQFIAQEGPGSIVCTSSIMAKLSIPGGTNAYTAAKGGIEALVRQVAVDYASRNIRINAVAPGAIDTPLMWATTAPAQVAQMRATIDSEIPLGKIGQPSDIAHCVAWLLSDEAAYVTGTTFAVDGGVGSKQVLSV